jgi:hypothetical protein
MMDRKAGPARLAPNLGSAPPLRPRIVRQGVHNQAIQRSGPQQAPLISGFEDGDRDSTWTRREGDMLRTRCYQTAGLRDVGFC